MYSQDYLLEKSTQALLDLAIGTGNAKSRVDIAYRRFWHIRRGNFPEHLRNKRIELERLLTRLPSREGYVISDNLRKMKNKTASKIAMLIVDIYFELVDLKEKSGPH